MKEYIKSSSIYVSPFGLPVCLPEIESGLELEDQILIIDAAASLPNHKYFNLSSKNRYAIMLSLHATKLIGAGEGGIVISNDVEWIKEFKKWTNFGFAGSRESDLFGSNAKMSEYSAAVALASINNFNTNYEVFQKLTNYCGLGTNNLNLSTHPAMSKGYISPYWIVKLNHSVQKHRLISELKNLDIEWRNWWGQGCHKMKVFSKIDKLGSLENTKTLSDLSIGLPFHHKLEESHIDLILQTLAKVRT
jgi:dTDP-4-amino-4,6-dideoxygalactose transaminase